MDTLRFEENIDYIIQSVNVQSQKRLRTYEQLDHIMPLDMAKEIAMIQRSHNSILVRQKCLTNKLTNGQKCL